jgi:hypothetical protein
VKIKIKIKIRVKTTAIRINKRECFDNTIKR